MRQELITIVVERPGDAARLQSYLLGLEILWPFQVAAFAGDATAPQFLQKESHEVGKDEQRI